MTAEPAKTKKDAHLWARHPDDWYVEERFASRELFKREEFVGYVYDPCCGRGHILAEAALAGYTPIGTDIQMRGEPEGFVQIQDFLLTPFDFGVRSVVMNPPYLNGRGIEAFVRQAMSLASVTKIAAFIPSKFLWGATRAKTFWTEVPPVRIYAITPRPSCPPGPVIEAGIEPGGGFEDFAWAVWERWLPASLGWAAMSTEFRWIVGER